jgi:hypothetical protein
MDEQELTGGRFANPVRRGDTVKRGPGPGHGYVHELLGYLQTAGFELAPRYLGTSALTEHDRLGFGITC